jgi:hypothetical protein
MLFLLRVAALQPFIVRVGAPVGTRAPLRARAGLRAVRWAPLLAALLCTWGCDRSDPRGGPRELFTSFEARCERIPARPAEVVAIPIAVVDDDTRSEAELTRLHVLAPSQYRTMGLTLTRVGHEATVAFTGVSDTTRGRSCFRTHVQVELFMRPLTVHVAREIAADACLRAVIHEHEMQHVAVYEAHLHAAAAELVQVLPAEFGDHVHYADDEAGAQRALQARLAQFLAGHLQRSSRELEAAQRAIDSPEEYARIAAACNGPR